MLVRFTMRRAVLGTTAALAAAAGAYSTNERVVEQRAAQLKGLRASSAACCDGYPRTACGDTEALTSFDRPIVVEGLIDSWPALAQWSFAALRERIGQAEVDCGSSTGGVPFYLVAANAARPAGRVDLALYVFDDDFSDESGKAGLLADGPGEGLPALTAGDVFAEGEAAEHTDRPVWRWLLAGPEGSGTIMHRDPWGYSSWNASLVGCKRWVLFPPAVARETLHPPRTDLLGRAVALLGLSLPRGAACFMEEVLPGLRGCDLGEVEIVQHPGEVVAFPAGWWHVVVNQPLHYRYITVTLPLHYRYITLTGWWHVVVNLDATLAVTESYGRARDLPLLLRELRTGGLAAFAAVVEREAAAARAPAMAAVAGRECTRARVSDREAVSVSTVVGER